MRLNKAFSLTFKEAVEGVAGQVESLVSPAAINLKKLFSINFLVNGYGTVYMKL